MSKQEIVIVPGVSSTITSTPVMISKAFMFRPSRPMTLPLMSSESIFTVVMTVSAVTGAV